MKIITLWQPWATLLVHGIKKIETRPKPTNWVKDEALFDNSEKGTYLIHAAKKWTKDQVNICNEEPFKTALANIGYYVIPAGDWLFVPKFPLGQIVGSVDIIECKYINTDETSAFYFDGNKIIRNYKLIGLRSFCSYICNKLKNKCITIKNKIMEKAFDFLFTKEPINDSKIYFSISFILNLIIATFLYTKLIGDYKIIDFKDTTEIINFFIKGHILAIFIPYTLIYVLSIGLMTLLFLIYSFFYFPSIAGKICNRNNISPKDIENLSINLDSFFYYKKKSISTIFKKLGAIKFTTSQNVTVFDDVLFNLWNKYLETPTIIIFNLAKIFVFILRFVCAYLISNIYVNFPIGLNIAIYILSLLLIVFIFAAIRDFARFETFVPALKKIKIISLTEYNKTPIPTQITTPTP